MIERIDLAIGRGEIFFLIGPSGCGKTTLLKSLGGLLPPSRGTVLVEGRDFYALDEGARNEMRLRMGMAFQGGALFHSISVLENVTLPLRESRAFDEREIPQIASLKLEMVGLGDALHRMPSELSGGMRKRAAIARAMALDPEILFLDEPTSGLDPVTAAGIDDLVGKLNRAFAVTVVAVSHDMASARALANRAALLREGRLLALDAPEELVRAEDPSIAAFVHRRAASPRAGTLGALFEPEGEP